MRRYADAKASIQSINMGIRPSGAPREYRIYYPELKGGRQEDTAYYTDDLDDAVLTAVRMRREKSGLLP